MGLASRSNAQWIDASRPIDSSTPVWPGDRGVDVQQTRIGDMTISSYSMTCHAGTHLDAPLHLDPTGVPVDGVSLQRLIGVCEVINVSVDCGLVRRADLPDGWLPSTERLLIRTDSHPVGAVIDGSFTGMAADMLEALISSNVALVGIDTPSVDSFDSEDLPLHHGLQKAGIWWIEGLDLTNVSAGFYEMIALPLAIRNTEAAPIRVLLKDLEEQQ
ncbi:MAG: hypothetical protein GY906_38860 [bacterium]|nr:hypothetical protein [bacterium]